MKTNEILENIIENGDFDNFNGWNVEEVKDWVLSNFDCSKYVANNVAFNLI